MLSFFLIINKKTFTKLLQVQLLIGGHYWNDHCSKHLPLESQTDRGHNWWLTKTSSNVISDMEYQLSFPFNLKSHRIHQECLQTSWFHGSMQYALVKELWPQDHILHTSMLLFRYPQTIFILNWLLMYIFFISGGDGMG